MNPIPPEIREFLSYNPETGICTWIKSRRRISVGSEAGTTRDSGHKLLTFKQKHYQLHRVAWFLYYGEDPGDKEVDHINGVRDDNRIINLRLVTHQQNQQNRKSAKGVYKHRNSWQSHFMVNGITHYLGTFPCPLLAGIAYQEAKSQLHTYT
jgi:hypothetical protein